MPALYLDEENNVRRVKESEVLTLEHVEARIKEAELRLKEAQDLRAQFMELKNAGQNMPLPEPQQNITIEQPQPQAVEPAPITPAEQPQTPVAPTNIPLN